MTKLLAAANRYLESGISVIATNSVKISLEKWERYQAEYITTQEITRQLGRRDAAGIAIICGKISGNLEVIDVDTKYDLIGDLWDNLVHAIPSEIFEKLCIIQTQSGGYHLYYRCEIIEESQKLANRPTTEEERKKYPDQDRKVLIETKGEGGYVIAVPTQGYSYFIKNRIPVITKQERETLIETCRSFDQMPVKEKPVPKPKSTTGEKLHGPRPGDAYNQEDAAQDGAITIGLLEKHGWTVVYRKGDRTYLKRPGDTMAKTSGDYHHGLNMFKSWSTSTPFETGSGYRAMAVLATLEYNGDFGEAAKWLKSQGYGEVPAGTDKHNKTIEKLKKKGLDDASIALELVQKQKLKPEEAASALRYYDAAMGENIGTFWEKDDKGKIRIKRNKLKNFLQNEGGFSLYFYDPLGSTYKMVQESHGFLSEATTQGIKEFIQNYVLSLTDQEPFDGGITVDELMEVVMTGADAYFSKGLQEFIQRREFDFLSDTATIAYFPFKNGVIKVTPDKIELCNYKEINKVIWKKQMVDFPVTVIPDFDPTLCEFSTFIDLISGKQRERIDYCRSLIGYLLHRYKDRSRQWAVALAEETDDEKKGGGTGKGLLVNAISHLANTQKIDGKNFKVDKNFAFQRVSLDTRICAIEDVKQGVDFKGFYSIITDGITVERKNQDEIFIKYEDSPKIVFTTNYVIKTDGVHGKRRLRVFEFSNYFSDKHTPIDEFGHKLFEDWNEDEMNRFYNYMFLCVQYYLKNDVNDLLVSSGFKRKSIKVSFSEEFLDYFDQICANGAAEWHIYGDSYQAFLDQNKWDKKDYSNIRFKKALSDACDVMGYAYESRRNRQANNMFEYRILVAKNEVKEEPKNDEIEF